MPAQPGSTQIGFVGLGIMGSPMAVHLQQAGHEVRGHNRSPAKTGPLVEAGAEARTVPRVHHGSIGSSEPLEGPALVISSTTTLWLPEGARLRADADGTLIIDPGTP